MSGVALLRSPGIVLMGQGAINNLVAEIRALGGTKALIVSDHGVVKAGLCDRVTNSLTKECIKHECFFDIEPEPSIATVEKATAIAVAIKADIIVAIGGGSPIDVAKSAAICAKTGASIRNFIGIDKVYEPGLPKIVIPTTSGSGSEVSPAVVLSDETDHTKKSVWSRYVLADVAIVDPMLMISMPDNVTAETGADALSHAIEAYVAKGANCYSDALALEAIRLIGTNLKKAYSNGNNIEAREKMAQAALLAGIAFSSSGLGCIHALAYPFTTFFGFSHGKANAIVIPGVMRFNSVSNEEKFKQIAEALGEKTEGLSVHVAALKASDAAEVILNDVGINTRIESYNIKKETLPKMADLAINDNKRLLVMNPRKMTVADALDIYEKSFYASK